jgi:hypothetical protein
MSILEKITCTTVPVKIALKYVAMFTVAAILASASSWSATDGTSDGIQKIDQLWMVIYVDDAGREIVPQAMLTSGNYAPLIAVDSARFASIVEAARAIATQHNIKLRVIKFNNRVDLQEIRP